MAGGLSISTEKLQYDSTESILAIIQNNYSHPVWVHTSCMPLFNIEKYDKGEWQWIDYYPTKGFRCRYKNENVKPAIELQPNDEYRVTINLKGHETTRPKIGPGKYRVKYSYSLSKESSDKNKAYSTEFNFTKIYNPVAGGIQPPAPKIPCMRLSARCFFKVTKPDSHLFNKQLKNRIFLKIGHSPEGQQRG